MSEALTPSLVWYTAYANPPGVKVRVSDPNRAKTLLYAARAKLKDPDLTPLEIKTSPTNPAGEIWVVNPEATTDPSANVDLGEI